MDELRFCVRMLGESGLMVLWGVKGGLNYSPVSGDRERYSTLLTPPLYIYIDIHGVVYDIQCNIT